MPASEPKSTEKPLPRRSPAPAHHLGFEATLWATAEARCGVLDLVSTIGLGDKDSRSKDVLDRVHHELTDEDIQKIARAYHAWRGDTDAGKYQDVAGSCKDATLDEIRTHGHVLTPGRYVGAEEAEDDGEPFEDKMNRLTAKLEEQFAESARLERAIRHNLKGLGYGL